MHLRVEPCCFLACRFGKSSCSITQCQGHPFPAIGRGFWCSVSAVDFFVDLLVDFSGDCPWKEKQKRIYRTIHQKSTRFSTELFDQNPLREDSALALCNISGQIPQRQSHNAFSDETLIKTPRSGWLQGSTQEKPLKERVLDIVVLGFMCQKTEDQEMKGKRPTKNEIWSVSVSAWSKLVPLFVCFFLISVFWLKALQSWDFKISLTCGQQSLDQCHKWPNQKLISGRSMLYRIPGPMINLWNGNCSDICNIFL